MISILFLFIFNDKRPANKIKGTIMKDGRASSICNSRSLAFLKIFLRSPSIGEMANPGNDGTMDME